MMEKLNVAICSKIINSVMVNNVLLSYAGSADEKVSLEDRCDILGWDIGSESNLWANQGDGIVGLPWSCSNGLCSCFKLSDDPKRCGSHTSQPYSRECSPEALGGLPGCGGRGPQGCPSPPAANG